MSPIHRAPAGLKLAASAVLILGLAALPAGRAGWGLCVLPVLLLITVLARLELKAQLSRWAFGLPFLLGVASLAAFQPHGLRIGLGLLLKSAISLFTLQLLASTTPIHELLWVLRRLRVPEPLCDALALLARYSSLLSEEARRMRRARAGRTLRASRFLLWRALGTSLGLLFVRTVSRAERVQIAMRSRGGG